MQPDALTESVLRLTGRLKIAVFGPDGGLKDEREIDNLVVTAGKVVIANRLCAAPSHNPMSHMAVGTGTTAPAAGDTTLTAEIAASRTALTSATPSGNAVTYACTFGPGVGTGAVAEAGLFNASSAGDMLAHTTFTAVTKGAGDTMTITWTVTVS